MIIIDYGIEGDEFLTLSVHDLKVLIPEAGKRIAYINKVKIFNEFKEKQHNAYLKENEKNSQQKNFQIDTLNQLSESDEDLTLGTSPSDTELQRIPHYFISLLTTLIIFFFHCTNLKIFRT